MHYHRKTHQIPSVKRLSCGLCACFLHLEYGIAGGSQDGQHHAAQRRTAGDTVHVGEQRNARIAHNHGHNLQIYSYTFIWSGNLNTHENDSGGSRIVRVRCHGGIRSLGF